MIKAIIIDDEAHCILRLQDLLKEYCKGFVQLFGSYQTIEEGIDAIEKHQPDLVFLDVQLNDKTGFDLLSELNEIGFEVIFTTAFEKYAVKAFKFSAVDYLLKPVDANDLLRAIEKLKQKISKEQLSQKFEVLLQNFKNVQGISKRISVPTMNGFSFIPVSDIIRCEAAVNYTILYLSDKQKLTVAKTLKEFENLLGDYNFCRIHHSHLINLAYIKSYNKGKGGFVVMTDQSEIEVSTRKKEEFLKRLSEI
ncbi:MAG: LytR/AlgR family response regulator transcription factor [Ilyomonas sp.]